MSTLGIVSLVFATVLYLINLILYINMIKDRRSRHFFSKIKLVFAIMIGYIVLCLAYWITITILFVNQGLAENFLPYIISTVYCIWCIYSMMDMLILPTKQKSFVRKNWKRVDYISYIVGVVDAIIFLATALLYVTIMGETTIYTQLAFIGVVLFAIVMLSVYLGINIKKRNNFITK